MPRAAAIAQTAPTKGPQRPAAPPRAGDAPSSDVVAIPTPPRARDGEVKPHLKPFFALNADGRRESVLDGPDPATVVVMGAQRSGTTMTAGLLQILGVEFGDDVADRGEDIALTACIQRLHHGLAFWRIPSVRRRFGRLLAERRAAWHPFGFKSPFLAPILWCVGDKIPRPVYIVMLRNPLGAAVSGERWGGQGWRSAFLRATFHQFVYACFATRTRRPVLLCSFEDAIKDTDTLLQHLANFLGVTVTDDMRERAQQFVQPTIGYRTTRRLQGWVETLTPERAIGWVADLTDPCRVLSVEISVDGNPVAKGPADLMREDVAQAGHHVSGHCGFDFTFERPLSEAEMRRVRIYIPELNHTLRFGLDGQVRSMYLPGEANSSSSSRKNSKRQQH